MDIQLSNISKRFENKTVLNKLNVTFKEGTINCLMGASGIGKTTLLHILMGLIKPDEGEIRGLHKKRFAAVFQEDRLIEHWGAVKNIRLVCDKCVTDEAIHGELSKVGLDEVYDKPVKSFSGGMRRRVALIRAIMTKSDILILDEPFKGMDVTLREKVIGYLKQKVNGKTIIIVTHDKEEAKLLEANIITLTQQKEFDIESQV